MGTSQSNRTGSSGSRRQRSRSIYRRRLLLTVAVLAFVATGVVLALIWSGEGSLFPLRSNSSREPQTSLSSDHPKVPDFVKIDLLSVNEYSRPGTPLDTVNGIVVHYVANPGTTAEQNRSYFASLEQTGATYASSHFIIGIDGTVIQCVPLDEISYCSNYRNNDTIAIECCHPDESGEFTKATYDSLVKLTRWLCDSYSLDTDQVIRHYDVTGKICPKYFVDHPDAWETFLQALHVRSPLAAGRIGSRRLFPVC